MSVEAWIVAVVGAVVGSLITAVAPRVFGAARTGIPRVLGVIKLTYVRTAVGAAFGLAAATGIALSTSDHSHKSVTYVLWYGLASAALVAVIGLTILIDSRSDERSAGSESPASRIMNPLIRNLQQQNKGAQAERQRAALPPLTDRERTEKAQRISGRAVDRASDNLLRALDKDDDEEPEQPAGVLPDGDSRHVELIERGEDLRAKVGMERTMIEAQGPATAGKHMLKEWTSAARTWGAEAGLVTEPPPIGFFPTGPPAAQRKQLEGWLKEGVGILRGRQTEPRFREDASKKLTDARIPPQHTALLHSLLDGAIGSVECDEQYRFDEESVVGRTHEGIFWAHFPGLGKRVDAWNRRLYERDAPRLQLGAHAALVAEERGLLGQGVIVERVVSILRDRTLRFVDHQDTRPVEWTWLHDLPGQASLMADGERIAMLPMDVDRTAVITRLDSLLAEMREWKDVNRSTRPRGSLFCTPISNRCSRTSVANAKSRRSSRLKPASFVAETGAKGPEPRSSRPKASALTTNLSLNLAA
ncbi:MAG TPA: hypothetical protein VGO29_09070 [Solirubrobacteraceae bacterium]|nr:hypothetical protein [Solirubrobacteraceae bacterium]